MITHQIALGDFDGTAELMTPGHDHGQASFHRHTALSWAAASSVRHESVRVSTLDAFVQSADVHRIDFIKVDTEGHELLLLKGGKSALQRFRPLVYMEVNDAWLATSGKCASNVAEEMRALGYRHVYRPNVPRRGVFDVVPASLESPVNGDFLFSTRPLDR